MSFLKQDKEKVLFSGDGELIYYIPEKYFESKAAIVIGEVVETIGIFTYAVFNKAGKMETMKLFDYPTKISCRPNSIEKVKDYHLTGTSEPKAYRLLHFKKDSELICNVNIPKEFSNLKLFLNLFMRANLPDNIPYNEVQNYVMDNAVLNNFNYKVSAQTIGWLISEIYRDAKDLSKPFRLSGSNDMTAYKAISVDNVPKYTSAFTAITSDNADEAIAAAMTTKGTGESPLEKIMMG
jgi:hypothetical protein